MEAARNAVRRHISCSHTSPPSPPRPQMRIRLCTQRSISASCSSEVHSIAHRHILLYIPSETLSLLFDRQHNPAAFGNNLGSAPLGKKVLEKNKEIRAFLKTDTVSFVDWLKESQDLHFVVIVLPSILKLLFLVWCLKSTLWTDGVIQSSLKNASFRPLFPAKWMLYM